MATQLEKLQKLAEETARKKAEIERTVYYDDFSKAFKRLMQYVETARQSLHDSATQTKGEIDDQLKTALSTIEMKAGDLNKIHSQAVDSLKSDQRTFQRMIDEKLSFFEDSLPEDYDDKEVKTGLAELRQIIDSLDIPEAFDATELTNKVEKNTEDIKDLKDRPAGKGVGRVTDKAVQYALMRSIQSVTPTGTVDGANATFTVPSTIHAILGFELGSRVISLGTYSITGSARKTIVFDDPIPANYSDDSFVVTYI